MTTDKSAGDGAIQVDTALIRQLAELLDETQLSEIEIEDNGRRIRVARGTGTAAVALPGPAAPAPAAAAPLAGTALAPAPANHPGMVKSPMVGTVYLSSEPGAPQFASVGDTVAAGDTLVIIEAMKVMNPILAPKSGKVTALLVENAEPVEFDQPLLILE